MLCFIAEFDEDYIEDDDDDDDDEEETDDEDNEEEEEEEGGGDDGDGPAPPLAQALGHFSDVDLAIIEDAVRNKIAPLEDEDAGEEPHDNINIWRVMVKVCAWLVLHRKHHPS